MLTVKNAELETVCGITSKFPATEYAELAFAGRSNVGKSSLMNYLLKENRSILTGRIWQGPVPNRVRQGP